MKNKDLIIKIARRLDKFVLDEIVTVSELDEYEVKTILAELLKEQIITKNNETYFFNNKKVVEISKSEEIKPANEIKPIVIEKEEGYDYFLTLNKDVQTKIRKYVELLNIVKQTSRKHLKQVVEFFNETSGYRRIPPSSFTRVLYKYNQYGFKGILPNYTNNAESPIPDEIYTYFKKYYLTKEKLSAQEAIYKAQVQLQEEQKIEQLHIISVRTLISKVRNEFTKEQIEYFRNNINPPKSKIKAMKITEPLDMTIQKAANIYLKRLKSENKLEKLMSEKTNYQNHLKNYFGALTIREITPKIVAKYKQKMFDNGYKLSSVNTYIVTLKKIIKIVCPKTNSLIERGAKCYQNVYALYKNFLSKKEIANLLYTCNLKYPLAYPLIYISLSTGASVPELLGLTWDRINFEDNIIFLQYFLYGERLIKNKGLTSRKLKIDDRISEILKKKFDKIKPNLTDFVFRFPSPKIPQQYLESVVLKTISKELGVAQLMPSDLQHNFVRLCLKQNISLTFIQKSLGFYGIINFVKMYRDLIETMEEKTYNPLEFLKNYTSGDKC